MEFQNKFIHSSPLDEHLERLEKQAQALHLVRNAYLLKEAERKHFESTLINASLGSMAERTARAQAKPEWLEFHQALAVLEANYEFEKLKYSILDKSFMAAYLELKLNEGEIRRQK